MQTGVPKGAYVTNMRSANQTGNFPAADIREKTAVNLNALKINPI